MPRTRQFQLLAAAVCAVLLAIFAIRSWSAAGTKSATADEPLHSLGGYMRWFHRDFRINPEDPPLAFYWAMIPHNRDTLRVDRTAAAWNQTLDYLWRQWEWVTPTLYRTPGNDPDRFITRSRAMMLIIAVGLGIILTVWAWKLVGPVAGIVVATLYSFDPSFLGHGPLVKNDVPITAVMSSAAFALWSVGRRARWWNVLVLAMLAGIAINTKFSGLILLPIMGALLVARTLQMHPWPTPLGTVKSLLSRASVALAIVLICGVACVAMTWAAYGFRFAPTAQPDARFNTSVVIEAAVGAQLKAASIYRPVTDVDVEEFHSKPTIRFVLWAEKHQLLPHAWLVGLLDTYATTRIRRTYLLGGHSIVGSWQYFPLAMLFKTPTPTLVAFAAAAAIFVRAKLRRRGGGDDPFARMDGWSACCLILPVAIYGGSALLANINLGLRHIFPVYPFLYLLVGVAAARAARLAPRVFIVVAGLLGLGLIVESVTAHPNYIAFFNTPSGGPRGGIRLLGDSNLDWGQDLKLLAAWQRANPQVRLFVAYFGSVDPDYYLDDYTALPGNLASTRSPQLPDAPGVAAISATNLQGIYLGVGEAMVYREIMRGRVPFEVLGGTIYLYDLR